MCNFEAVITWEGKVIYSFIIGIVVVWIYAAIRPRFGASAKTAVIAGLFLWFSLWVLGFGSLIPQELYPKDLIIITIVWGLFEVPIAAVAGAYIYKE